MDKQKNQAMTNAEAIRALSNDGLAGIIECPVSLNGGKTECDFPYPDDASPSECLACKAKWLREEAFP